MNRPDRQPPAERWQLLKIVFLITLFIFYSGYTRLSQPEFVLCRGDNGHLSIEYANAGLHCGADKYPVHRQESGIIFLPAEWDPDDCHDIPLFSTPALPYLSTKEKQLVPLSRSMIYSTAQLNFPTVANANFQIKTVLFERRALVALETTVLLI